MRAVVRWLARLDWEGALGELFDVPEALPPAGASACLREECWIFGTGG